MQGGTGGGREPAIFYLVLGLWVQAAGGVSCGYPVGTKYCVVTNYVFVSGVVVREVGSGKYNEAE